MFNLNEFQDFEINAVYYKLMDNYDENKHDIETVKKIFSYPFDEFYGESFLEINKTSPFIGSADDEILRDLTPKNIYDYIDKIFYCDGNEHDGKDYPGDSKWVLIFEFSYKNEKFYGYYEANCSYTGFSAHGDMVFYSSKDIKNLITFAMGKFLRSKILD